MTKRTRILLGAFTLVALIAAWQWQRRRQAAEAEAQRRMRAAQALADLRQCLLGNETAIATLRLAELADNPGWPERCATHASALYGALSAEEGELHEALELHFDCATACATDEPARRLTGLPASTLPTVDSKVEGPQRVTAPLLSATTLPTWSPPDLEVVDRQQRLDGSVALLLTGARVDAQRCTLSPDSHVVRCEKTSAQALAELELPKREELAEQAPNAAVSQACRNGGPTVVMLDTAALMFFDDERWRGPVRFDTRTGASSVAKAPPNGDGKAREGAGNKALEEASSFGVAGLLESGNGPSADSPWGKVPQGSLAKHKRMFEEPTKPVETARARQTRPHLPKHFLACTAKGATVVWRRPDTDADEVHRLHCDADGCRDERVELKGLDVEVWWAAADMGEAQLLAWRDRRGLLGYRFAPLADLATTTTVTLMDLPRYGGTESDDLEVFVAPGAAFVLFRDNGMRGMRFDANGHVKPLESR